MREIERDGGKRRRERERERYERERDMRESKRNQEGM